MNDEVKPCIKCGAQDRNKRGACKPCIAERGDKYRESNRERIAEQKRKYNEVNREKQSERSRKHYEANRDKLLERHRKWREANKERAAARGREWREANREKVDELNRKWREANRGKLAERSRKWAEANPEKRKVIKHNRRAKVKGNGGKLSPNIVQTLMALQKGKCACCGESLGNGHHLDHVIPIALGGKNTDDNVQLLTPKCNLSKGAKHPVDYMRTKGKLI